MVILAIVLVHNQFWRVALWIGSANYGQVAFGAASQLHLLKRNRIPIITGQNLAASSLLEISTSPCLIATCPVCLFWCSNDRTSGVTYEWLWQNLTVYVKAHYPMAYQKSTKKCALFAEMLVLDVRVNLYKPERSAPFRASQLYLLNHSMNPYM